MLLFQPHHWCATCEERYPGAFRIYKHGEAMIEFCSDACAANEPYTYAADLSDLATRTFDSKPVHALREDLYHVDREAKERTDKLEADFKKQGDDLKKLLAAQLRLQVTLGHIGELVDELIKRV